MSNPENPAPPPAPTRTDAVAEFRALVVRLQAGVTHLEALNAESQRRLDAQASGSPTHIATQAGAIADDADLDGQWGNPVVRKNPPRWAGADFAGTTYSECPPEFLDSLAGFLEWQAAKADEKNEMANNGKPRSGYLRKDAARARGHAARIRAKPQVGRPQAKPSPEPIPGLDDDMPASVPFLGRHASPSPRPSPRLPDLSRLRPDEARAFRGPLRAPSRDGVEGRVGRRSGLDGAPRDAGSGGRALATTGPADRLSHGRPGVGYLPGSTADKYPTPNSRKLALRRVFGTITGD